MDMNHISCADVSENCRRPQSAERARSDLRLSVGETSRLASLTDRLIVSCSSLCFMMGFPTVGTTHTY